MFDDDDGNGGEDDDGVNRAEEVTMTIYYLDPLI